MSTLLDLLARNLGQSKSAIRPLLADGGIADEHGEVLSNPRMAIDETGGPFAVIVDGERRVLHHACHLLLNKPTGVVTALRDDHHPTAYDLVADAPLHAELRAVGRLDVGTTGLLLWTTDGALVQRLTHPKRRVPRTYQAALARACAPMPADLVLDDGHRPEITDLRPLQPDDLHPALARPDDATAFASITIIGGAYHEVRRIFAALGSHVLGLCRVSFGRLTLPTNLATSAWRPFDPGDV